MFLLQTTTINRGTDLLLQYGVLGLFAIIMLYAIWYFEKQRRKTISAMELKIATLERRMEEQRKEHEDFVKGEFKQSVEVNRKALDLMDEVKELLIKLKI
jgi:amino acid permease